MTECRGNDEDRAFEFSIRADDFESATYLSGPSKAGHRRKLKSPPPKGKEPEGVENINSSQEGDADSD